MNALLANCPPFAIVCKNQVLLNGYRRLFRLFPKEITREVEIFQSITNSLEYADSYTWLFVFGWLGEYSGQIECNINTLPKTIYVQGTLDYAPCAHEKVQILYRGTTNEHGLICALQNLSLIQ